MRSSLSARFASDQVSLHFRLIPGLGEAQDAGGILVVVLNLLNHVCRRSSLCSDGRAPVSGAASCNCAQNLFSRDLRRPTRARSATPRCARDIPAPRMGEALCTSTCGVDTRHCVGQLILALCGKSQSPSSLTPSSEIPVCTTSIRVSVKHNCSSSCSIVCVWLAI